MILSVNQINSQQLTSFITNAVSGTSFNQILQTYLAQSGWLGPTVLGITGGNQTVLTTVTFSNAPFVPYTGGTGTAVNRQWVFDTVSGAVLSYSGFVGSNYIDLINNYTIAGTKLFTGVIKVPSPSDPASAISLQYLAAVSGVLNSSFVSTTPANVVFTTGNQIVSGQKRFDQSPLVPVPTDPSGAVPLSYVTGLSAANAVLVTGSQSISGTKTFLESPIVPLATQANQAISKQQLDAGITAVAIGTGGFAGVSSLNGTSGASGAVFLIGAGTVSIYQCAELFYISGATANNTQLFTASVVLPSGVTGLAYTFGSGFTATPVVVGSLRVTGASGLYLDSYTFNESTSGFGVAFSQAIPNNSYSYSFTAIPAASGSGFLGIQGQPGNNGRSPNARGNWTVGVMYSPLDYVFISGGTNYIATQAHNSDISNRPAGTGTAVWQIFSSGAVGPTGYWDYVGDYNALSTYTVKQSVTYDDSTWGYTGAASSSGIIPQVNISGWKLLAKKGGVGYFINSGIITGVFTNVSLFLSPVGSGLDLVESFCGYGFNLTGFALGAVQSGLGYFAGSGPLTGRLYVRDLNNAKHVFQTFTFDRGLHSYVSGGLAYQVTGMQRLGLDITNTLSGIDKFSVGVFGFGF